MSAKPLSAWERADLHVPRVQGKCLHDTINSFYQELQDQIKLHISKTLWVRDKINTDQNIKTRILMEHLSFKWKRKIVTPTTVFLVPKLSHITTCMATAILSSRKACSASRQRLLHHLHIFWGLAPTIWLQVWANWEEREAAVLSRALTASRSLKQLVSRPCFMRADA